MTNPEPRYPDARDLHAAARFIARSATALAAAAGDLDAATEHAATLRAELAGTHWTDPDHDARARDYAEACYAAAAAARTYAQDARDLEHDAARLARAAGVVAADAARVVPAAGARGASGAGRSRQEYLTPVPGARVLLDEDGEPIIDRVTCGTCGRSWNDAAVSTWTPAPSGRCPFEYDHEEDSCA